MEFGKTFFAVFLLARPLDNLNLTTADVFWPLALFAFLLRSDCEHSIAEA